MLACCAAEMDYSAAYMERMGIVVLENSNMFLGGKMFGQARRVVITRDDVDKTPPSAPMAINEAYTGIAFDGMTVAELLDLGRSRGLKVTTKMTKAQLIAVLAAN